MSKKNLKSLVAALWTIIVSIIVILIDCFWAHSQNGWLLSIGCSLLASAVFLVLNAMYVEKQAAKPLDSWKLTEIYRTRAEKNQDSDPKLKDAKYQIDGVAFGLRSFRSNHTPDIEDCLRRGVQIRLVAMKPNSKFALQRDKEEGENEGHIGHSVQKLVEWANELNSKGYNGQIKIKGYSCMTLDFYWRVDDDLYVGPYWYGYQSQQTITMKFERGGKGFDEYSQYFEKLWNDESIMTPLN